MIAYMPIDRLVCLSFSVCLVHQNPSGTKWVHLEWKCHWQDYFMFIILSTSNLSFYAKWRKNDSKVSKEAIVGTIYHLLDPHGGLYPTKSTYNRQPFMVEQSIWIAINLLKWLMHMELKVCQMSILLYHTTTKVSNMHANDRWGI